MAARSLDNPILPEPAATLGADSIPSPFENDDESEWEYEYSTTETETYYLTVDLSVPALTHRKRTAPHSSRGGYHHKSWAEPHKPKFNGPKNHRIISDDDDEPMTAVDEDGDAAQSRREPTAGAPIEEGKDKGKDKAKEPEEIAARDIQILDLHSDKPIFSYRGRIFEGQWTRNVGTELLFASHNDDNPLPAIRNLPGNVDMLAASWSRIATKELHLEPKAKEVERPAYLEAIKKQHGIQIPIWSDTTGQRGRQNEFLENLMALKIKKGEKDDVTVYAQGITSREAIASIHGPKKRRRRPAGRGRGRKRKSPSTRDEGIPLEEIGEAAESSSHNTPVTRLRSGVLSMPTVERWEDLDDDDDEFSQQMREDVQGYDDDEDGDYEEEL